MPDDAYRIPYDDAHTEISVPPLPFPLALLTLCRPRVKLVSSSGYTWKNGRVSVVLESPHVGALESSEHDHLIATA